MLVEELVETAGAGELMGPCGAWLERGITPACGAAVLSVVDDASRRAAAARDDSSELRGHSSGVALVGGLG